ncbi:uncharacterized protein LOC142344272 isoform X2 [Convolutriloba macropyga]|uniref:uncharacterized protein LOC142344272 isoform X2 n=1 Tax=Convolutriloba macropyga TaxID=536237 RepID=UPI003F521821
MSTCHARMYLLVRADTAQTLSFRIVMASQLVRFTLRVKDKHYNLYMKAHDTTFYRDRSTLKIESQSDGGDMQVLRFLITRQRSSFQSLKKHRFKQSSNH